MQPKRLTVLSTLVGVGLMLLAPVGYADEIVLDAPVINGQSAGNKAVESAVRARIESGQTRVSVQPASGVAVDLNGGESIFPQHGDDSLPNAKARELRNNAKERESNSIILPQGGVNDVNVLPPDAAAREGVAANLSKARAYMKNSTSQRVSELPVVLCDNVANVTGRIGDDSQSGSIITIMINGKQVKARCK